MDNDLEPPEGQQPVPKHPYDTIDGRNPGAPADQVIQFVTQLDPQTLVSGHVNSTFEFGSRFHSLTGPQKGHVHSQNCQAHTYQMYWKNPSNLKGSLGTIPKRSQRIATDM